MRFLVDECLSRHFLVRLVSAGHDAVWVQDICPAASDEKVLKLATDEGRIVISQDWDFGELVFRLALPAKGIVIVPVHKFEASLDTVAAYAVELIAKLGDSCLGSLTVIEPHKTRQRPITRD